MGRKGNARKMAGVNVAISLLSLCDHCRDYLVCTPIHTAVLHLIVSDLSKIVTPRLSNHSHSLTLSLSLSHPHSPLTSLSTHLTRISFHVPSLISRITSQITFHIITSSTVALRVVHFYVLVLLQVLGQEVLHVLLLLAGRSVDRWVHWRRWAPWLRRSDSDNSAQSGKSQHVWLDRSSENRVSGTHW